MRSTSLLALFVVGGALLASAQESGSIWMKTAPSGKYNFTSPLPYRPSAQMPLSRAPRAPFDRIYLDQEAIGGEICGNIVSYNFSPGESPKLESVTTCTPSNKAAVRRLIRDLRNLQDTVVTVSDTGK